MTDAINLPLTQRELDRIVAGKVLEIEIPDEDDPDRTAIVIFVRLKKEQHQ